jgi:hypothetical protein
LQHRRSNRLDESSIVWLQPITVLEQPMSFAIYIVGVIIFIGGLIYGAVLMSIPAHWIVVMALVLLGLSVLTGVNVTRQKDSAD